MSCMVWTSMTFSPTERTACLTQRWRRAPRGGHVPGGQPIGSSGAPFKPTGPAVGLVVGGGGGASLAPPPEGRAMETRVVSPGPYRATKLWNEVTKYFRAEMPRRKHRQHFKKYGNCFTAAEAISWLHELLRNNSNFGPEVTRQQTIQLLRKFLKNHVIEDVKGRWGSENLDDNQNLYRFPPTSPVKILPRKHLLSEKAENIPKETENVFKLSKYSRRTPKKYAFQECQENKENIKGETMEEGTEKTAHSRQITPEDIEEIWRNIIMLHLQTVLSIPSLDDILNPTEVVPQYIIYNMTNTSKRGVVVLQERSEDLPYWVLSAMKCLANWPRSNDMNQPTYVGFERDVFKTVADYFCSLPEPLLTFQYYELFVNILVLCGYITIPNRSCGTQKDSEHSKTPHLNSFKSTECLLLSLLRRETAQKDGSQTTETVLKNCTTEKRCHVSLQHCNVLFTGGSCLNLSSQQNEHILLPRRQARCYSLEGIAETASSMDIEDRRKTLSQTGMYIMPFLCNENQFLQSNPNSLLDICPHVIQKQAQGFKGVSASCFPDQDLSTANYKSNQLRRSQSVCGNTLCSWCGIHAPVAEITVKPHPVFSFGQKSQSNTKGVAQMGRKARDSDMAINKRLCKSATQLSESTFSPSSFMLTGSSQLLQPHLERVAIEALQICCLLLPPPNRRKLQLLMRMISRMTENVDMPRLHNVMGNRSLMIQTFARCILCCEEEVDLDELLAVRLVSFLMDHHQEILDVPSYLQVAVQDYLKTLKTTQVECLGDELSTIFPTYSFCKRITSQEFDEQKIYTSQAAVAELLENIIKDRHLSLKDKKKKLKQFQKEYPQIYRDRFPTTESEAILFEDKPRIKQPMLSLRKPKFRTMRN